MAQAKLIQVLFLSRKKVLMQGSVRQAQMVMEHISQITRIIHLTMHTV